MTSLRTAPVPTSHGTERDHLIDAARALSVVVVVLFHAGLWEVRRTDEGWQARTLDLGPVGWYGSWFIMVMPLFFVAGGFAHALVVDKMHERGTGLAHYFANRGRRLLGPTTVFVTFFAVLSTVAAWAGHLDDAATISHNLTKLLWFLVVYLVIVLLAPVMVWLHDRSPWLVLIGLFGASAVVDVWMIHTGVEWDRYPNYVFVWLAAHQLGIAYQRGFLRTGPRWHAWAAVAVGAGAIAWLLSLRFGATDGWPPSAVGLGSQWVSNLQPPTVLMALLALAQTGVLAILSRRRLRLLERPGVQRAVEVVNALLMTVYLWHMPCVVLSFGIGIGVGLLFPAAMGVTTSPLFKLAVALLLIALVVPLVARMDLKMIPPLGARQHGPVAVASLVLLTVSLIAVWRNGLVIHPSEPWSSLGVIGVWVGSALGAWAANRPAKRPA